MLHERVQFHVLAAVFFTDVPLVSSKDHFQSNFPCVIISSPMSAQVHSEGVSPIKVL